MLHLGTVCSRKGQVFSATACAKLIQDLACNGRVVRIILDASYITSHTPRLTVCTIYLHRGIHIICWLLGAFVCNKHTLFLMSPCFFHVKRMSSLWGERLQESEAAHRGCPIYSWSWNQIHRPNLWGLAEFRGLLMFLMFFILMGRPWSSMVFLKYVTLLIFVLGGSQFCTCFW